LFQAKYVAAEAWTYKHRVSIKNRTALRFCFLCKRTMNKEQNNGSKRGHGQGEQDMMFRNPADAEKQKNCDLVSRTLQSNRVSHAGRPANSPSHWQGEYCTGQKSHCQSRFTTEQGHQAT